MFYVGCIGGAAKDDWRIMGERYCVFLVIDREQKCDRTEEFLFEGRILWSDVGERIYHLLIAMLDERLEQLSGRRIHTLIRHCLSPYISNERGASDGYPQSECFRV